MNATMTSPRAAPHGCNSSKQWAHWLLSVCLASTLSSCGRQLRPLTIREQSIPVLPGTPEESDRLHKECEQLGKVKRFANWDYAIREAGEQRAQVVQNLVAHLEVEPGTDRELALTLARQESELRKLPFDGRLWYCPPSRAKIRKGELVWRRSEEFGNPFVLVRDGEVVSNQSESYEGLSDLVAAHPSAAWHAKRAEFFQERGLERGTDKAFYVILPATGLALSGLAVAGVGKARDDNRLMWGGLAGTLVFTIVATAVVSSHDPWEANLALTEAMNAADVYNDAQFGEDRSK